MTTSPQPAVPQTRAHTRVLAEQHVHSDEDLLAADPAWHRTPHSISGLMAPRDPVTSAVAYDVAPVLAEPTVSGPSNWYQRCARFLAAAVVSNNTYSMIGNLIITSHLPAGSYLQLGCAALAVWNEMRERERVTTQLGARTESPWRQAISTLVWSPGIYRYSLFAAFCANAFEQGLQQGTGLGVAFLLLAMGNLCVGHDLNRTYFARLRTSAPSAAQPSSPSKGFLGELFTSGVLYWAMADVLVGTRGIHQLGEGILTAPPLFALGVVCAAASVLSTCVLGKRAQHSVVPFGLNALTNYVFAVANYLYVPGTQALAASICLWGTGSAILAFGKLRSRVPEKPL
jgi:hypothetical protein